MIIEGAKLSFSLKIYRIDSEVLTQRGVAAGTQPWGCQAYLFQDQAGKDGWGAVKEIRARWGWCSATRTCTLDARIRSHRVLRKAFWGESGVDF